MGTGARERLETRPLADAFEESPVGGNEGNLHDLLVSHPTDLRGRPNAAADGAADYGPRPPPMAEAVRDAGDLLAHLNPQPGLGGHRFLQGLRARVSSGNLASRQGPEATEQLGPRAADKQGAPALADPGEGDRNGRGPSRRAGPRQRGLDAGLPREAEIAKGTVRTRRLPWHANRGTEFHERLVEGAWTIRRNEGAGAFVNRPPPRRRGWIRVDPEEAGEHADRVPVDGRDPLAEGD